MRYRLSLVAATAIAFVVVSIVWPRTMAVTWSMAVFVVSFAGLFMSLALPPRRPSKRD